MTTPDKEKRRKKVSSILGMVISVLLFLLVLTVFISAIQARRENRPATFFGYSFSIVVTASMEPEIKVGDLIIVKETATMSEVKQYDNIVFTSKQGAIAGERIVHKVMEIREEDGELYFVTQGVNNNGISDEDAVDKNNFIGIAVYHSTVLGVIFGFFSRLENWILIVVLAITLPIVIRQAKKIILYIRKGNVNQDGNFNHDEKFNQDKTELPPQE